MKLCIAGKNNIAVDCLKYAFKFIKKSEICVVLNKSDNFKNTWQKSLGFYAKKENIEIKTLAEVQRIKDIVFLSLEFDKIINPELFNSKKLYNIHFSLLPEYKGMYTSLIPILHGKNYSGVSLHFIDKGIDTGDIIKQVKFDITNLNSSNLYLLYLKKGTELVCKTMPDLLFENVKAVPQSSILSTYYSKTSFDFIDRRIITKQTAFQIQQFVKALTFRVYQLPFFNEYEIYKTQITDIKSTERPGIVLKENDEFIEIASIDYNIKLFKDYYNELIDCCKNDNFDRVVQIIDLVPNLNEIESNGWNPLMIACYFGANNVVKLLLGRGADPNLTNLNGTTTLMYAKDAFLKNRDFSIIDLLLKKGANIYSLDIWGKNIFDYTKDVELIEHLENYYD